MIKKTFGKLGVSLVALAMSLATVHAGDEFQIDTTHSFMVFRVSHSKVGMAYGRFNSFSGTVNYDAANPSATTIELEVDAESIDTGNERRDKHLRSPDFFNVNQFSKITFKSTRVEKKGENTLTVTGNLTMAGVTKPASFEVEVGGPVEHPRGGMLLGMQVSGSVNRGDFGVNYGLDSGGLGNEVSLMIGIEAVKK